MRKFIKLIKEKWLRQTSLTIVLIGILIACFIVLNLAIHNMGISPIDFTQDKRYSLTDDSKDQIKKVEQNVSIYFFGYDENSSAVILGKQYHDENDKISVYVIDANERPDLATKFGVTSGMQLIAVTSNERNKIIDYSNLYSFDSSTGSTVDVTEQKITNAILDVTIESKPQVCFLTGHQESSIENDMLYLSQYITNEVYDVKQIDLITSDMPAICDTLIIANPIKDFADIEVDRLQNYINNGGKIIWLQDPYITSLANYNSSTLPNITKILSQYGISFSNGIVCEESENNKVYGYPDLIIPNLTYNEIVKDIYTDGNILMMDAGKINTVSDEQLEELGVTAEAFVKSTEHSYYKEKFDAKNGSLSKSSGDETGPFVLGETLTKKIDENKKSTLVAFSNSLFVSNKTIALENTYTVPIALRNNKDIILNSVAFLSDREDTIRIRKDVGLVTFETPTETQNMSVRIAIFGLPVVFIVIGIIVTIVRKRKK